MNQLFRGVERSGCYLRRAVRPTRTSVASSVAQNLILQQHQNQKEPTSSGQRFQSVCNPLISPGHVKAHRSLLLRDDGATLYRHLSSLDAGTVGNDDHTESSATHSDTVQDDAGTESSVTQRPPSGLEQANLKEVLPGRALHVLHKYAAKGMRLIRQSDFVQLCDSSRPGKKRDAKVIATAMREFKNNNRFVLQTVGARAAMDGMFRSMVPTWKVQDGKPRVQAAVFVAQQILDERTGLYFAVETAMVDKVLEELREGLVEMEKHGLKVKVEKTGEEGKSEEELSVEAALAEEALRVTAEVTKLLIKRKTGPDKKTKKRALRKYRKFLQVKSGPYNSTMSLATQISLMIGDSAFARENILSPYKDAWWSKKRSNTLRRINVMIQEASVIESGELDTVEAPAAVGETEGEGIRDEVEDADSSVEGGNEGDAGNVGGNEGNPDQVDESGEKNN